MKRQFLIGILLTVSLLPSLVCAEETVAKATVTLKGFSSRKSEGKAVAALKKVPGVTDAQVNYTSRSAVVTYDPEKVKTEQLIDVLRKVGFSTTPAQSKYICPKCQATYQAGGACLICQTTLQPIVQEEPVKKE